METPLIDVDMAAVERSIGTFTEGEPTDPYRAEAAKIFMTKESEVTEKQRLYAKQLMYRKMYGGRG